MEDEKKEIPSTTKWLMLGTAFFFDALSLVSLIPVIGWVLGFFVWLFAFMTFWTWFMMYGVNIIGFRNPKKLAGSVLASIIEVFPEIGAIPAWSFLVFWLTRAEKIISKVTSKVPMAGVVGGVVSKVPGGAKVAQFIPKNSRRSVSGSFSQDDDMEKAA